MTFQKSINLFTYGHENMQNVINIRLGSSHAYLVKGNAGYLLIDAGNSNMKNRFVSRIKLRNIEPEDIKLIVVTHAHHDHVGSLSEIKELTKAQVIIHSSEVKYLKQGRSIPVNIIHPLGKIFAFIFKRIGTLISFDPVEPDIEIKDEFDLRPFGFKAKIVPTPGHTAGSVSVIFADGTAFVGDTCFNIFPFTKSVFPTFANDVHLLLESWDKLLTYKLKRIYPGHGRPFKINKLKYTLKKYK